MAVMEISMPSGYQADEEEAKKLVGTVPELARVDVQDEGTKLNIYFDKVKSEKSFQRKSIKLKNKN